MFDDFLPRWGMPGHHGEGLNSYPTDATHDIIPIPCHSHNDYWRRAPLYDALHWVGKAESASYSVRPADSLTHVYQGCTGVEADVWLVNGTLFVSSSIARNISHQLSTDSQIGHEMAALTPDRTFASLYVNPLVSLIEGQNPQTQFTVGQTSIKCVHGHTLVYPVHD